MRQQRLNYCFDFRTGRYDCESAALVAVRSDAGPPTRDGEEWKHPLDKLTPEPPVL